MQAQTVFSDKLLWNHRQTKNPPYFVCGNDAKKEGTQSAFFADQTHASDEGISSSL